MLRLQAVTVLPAARKCDGRALAAIAIRAAATAVGAIAAGGSVHVEPVGEAGAAVAASEGIAGATGEADGEHRGEQHAGEPIGHDGDLPLWDARRTSRGAMSNIDGRPASR